MTHLHGILFEQVKEFVKQEVPPPRKGNLLRQTELLSDLRIAEEDADDLLMKYFSTFGIAEGDFDFSRYFPSEGLWLLPRFRKAKNPIPISLGMLELAAKIHLWDTKVLEEAYMSNNYDHSPERLLKND